MTDYPVRPEVLRLQPYVPGKPISEVQREYGLTDVVKLASNENPLGPSPMAIEAVREAVRLGHIYPESSARVLRQSLAQHLRLPEDWIMVGNGSDELLRLLAGSFVHMGDRALVPGCSFPNYRAVTELFGGIAEEIPLKNETMDLERMAELAPGVRFIFLCSPNNPTGAVFGEDAFRAFMAAVPPETFVVLDQAYYEFDDSSFDALSYLQQYPNLIVTRTFSKAYGLAGLRVGYGMARPEIWKPCYQVREPFSTGTLGQAAALAALHDAGHLAATVTNNREGRAFLVSTCEELGLAYIPSQANFLMINLGRPVQPVFEGLLRQGVIVRPGTSFGRPNWMRVTVGTPPENRRFAAALKAVLAAT